MGFAVRPSMYAGWGSTGMTNVVEPLDAKKAVGWAIAESPASSYLNWIIQKQDQWIQYLSWKDSLTTVISEDFAYMLPIQATQINWQAGPPNFTLFGTADGALGKNGMGAGLCNWAEHSGILEFSRYIGNPAGRDFYMEFLYQFASRSTDLPVELGMFYPSAQSGYAGPIVGFVGSGGTGPFMFQLWPSGAASPTQVSMGMTFSNPSNIAKWTIESRGPTMAFYMDDVLKGSVPAVPWGASGAAMHCGVRACSTGFSSLAQGYIDGVYLRVKRP